MGDGGAVATIPEAWVPGSSSPDTMGEDSALHDSLMFGEDAPAATPDTALPSEAEMTVICPAEHGERDMCAGMHVKELSSRVMAQQALLAQQAPQKPAAPEAMQPARILRGFAPGTGSQSILRKAKARTHRCTPTFSVSTPRHAQEHVYRALQSKYGGLGCQRPACSSLYRRPQKYRWWHGHMAVGGHHANHLSTYLPSAGTDGLPAQHCGDHA